MTSFLTPLGDDAVACDGGICTLPDPSADSATALPKLTLISFPTCPFVQRAVIALKERGVAFETIYIDLADKPDWFLAISPLGKVPVLKIEGDGGAPVILFESAVILEYLDETLPGQRLYPADPLARARQRSWIEYAGSALGDLYRLGQAKDAQAFQTGFKTLKDRLTPLESEVAGPLFTGTGFSAVDVVYAPFFRQIDAIETVAPLGLLDDLPKLQAWRKVLASRPSVRDAVPADFVARYLKRLHDGGAYLLKSQG